MIYLAYELLAHLNILTLTGYDDGDYEWIGKRTDFVRIPYAEEAILRDWKLGENRIKTLPAFEPSKLIN